MQLIKPIFLLAALASAFLFAVSGMAPRLGSLDRPGTTASSTVIVAFDKLDKAQQTGILYLDAVPFTGFAVKKYDTGQLAEKTFYVDGKREGISTKWYPDGTKSFEAGYTRNRRHGITKTWWSNGTLRAESNYINGVAHGVQRQWYQRGALFKKLNLNHGKEDGLQQAWRENGKLYANYEALDGKIYGLKRANLCFDLDGETLQTSNQVQQ